MKNIKDYDLKELKEELANIGEKPFRAEQIFKWLYQEKVKSFDEMTNLSLELREKLKQNYTICNFKILRKQEAKDGTIKYLFDVLDENAIETVLNELYKRDKVIDLMANSLTTDYHDTEWVKEYFYKLAEEILTKKKQSDII